MDKLTKEECFKIINMGMRWNTSQKSISLAWNGIRTDEDDILDARRSLILKATKRLEELT